jgi:hypothetical protein
VTAALLVPHHIVASRSAIASRRVVYALSRTDELGEALPGSLMDNLRIVTKVAAGQNHVGDRAVATAYEEPS